MPNAPLGVKMIIFVLGYVLWDAFTTMVNVPYGSILPLISKDAADRASLSAWRSVGALVGNMLPIAILPFFVYDDANNLIGKRMFFAAILLGSIGFLSFQYILRIYLYLELLVLIL